jgi:hypothetical protein
VSEIKFPKAGVHISEQVVIEKQTSVCLLRKRALSYSVAGLVFSHRPRISPMVTKNELDPKFLRMSLAPICRMSRKRTITKGDGETREEWCSGDRRTRDVFQDLVQGLVTMDRPFQRLREAKVSTKYWRAEIGDRQHGRSFGPGFVVGSEAESVD